MARKIITSDNVQSDRSFQILQDLLGNANVFYLRVQVMVAELPNNKDNV